MKALQEINNQQLFRELKERVVENKITQKQLEEIFSKMRKLAKEKELEKAYHE